MCKKFVCRGRDRVFMCKGKHIPQCILFKSYGKSFPRNLMCFLLQKFQIPKMFNRDMQKSCHERDAKQAKISNDTIKICGFGCQNMNLKMFTRLVLSQFGQLDFLSISVLAFVKCCQDFLLCSAGLYNMRVLTVIM